MSLARGQAFSIIKLATSRSRGLVIYEDMLTKHCLGPWSPPGLEQI